MPLLEILLHDVSSTFHPIVIPLQTLAAPTPVFVSLITMLRPSYSVGGKGRTEDVAQDGVSMAQLITKCLLRLNQVREPSDATIRNSVHLVHDGNESRTQLCMESVPWIVKR